MTPGPQLPPRTVITCPVAGHEIRTRQPPGSVLPCTSCGQSGRHGVTVTVPAPLPAVQAPLPASPEGVAIISRRKTAPERCKEVCRAPIGPGLWPGPRRQARWAGIGSGAQGWVPKILFAARLKGSSDALESEGPPQGNARRSVLGPWYFRTAIGAPGARLTASTSSRRAASGDVIAGTGCTSARAARE